MSFYTGFSSGLWLLSTPKTVGWLDVLSKIPSLNVNSQTLDLLKNGLPSGTCLYMTQIQDSAYKFELNRADCNEKQFAVCRIDPPRTAAPSKPPKFPCLNQGSSARRKRNIDDGKFLENKWHLYLISKGLYISSGFDIDFYSSKSFIGQDLPRTTYNGFCRNPQYDKNIIDFIPVNAANECHLKCRNKNDCAAFAFNSKTTVGLSNCDLYRNGPYTQGTGASDIICYVIEGTKLESQ